MGMVFALPAKLFLSQPMSCLTFTLPILSPTGGEWARGCLVFGCQLGL